MLSTRLAVAGLSLAMLATPALAQNRGWLEVGAFGAHSFFDRQYVFDNELGIGGRVGVFLHPMFQLEGEGQYMDLDVNGTEFRPNGRQANYTPLYLRGTANFPVSANGFAFTTGAGITRTSYRYTYNWGASGSVGVKIPLMSIAALRIEGVADYLPTPKATNLNLRAGLSFYSPAALQTIIERVTVTDDSELLRLRSDAARLDSIAAAYNRLRDSLAANPVKPCDCPAPAPIKTEKDRVPAPAPIKTEKDRRVP